MSERSGEEARPVMIPSRLAWETDGSLSGHPVVITFVPWNPETDMAEVRHDGKAVWQDGLGHIDQYLQNMMPQGVPVILEVREE